MIQLPILFMHFHVRKAITTLGFLLGFVLPFTITAAPFGYIGLYGISFSHASFYGFELFLLGLFLLLFTRDKPKVISQSIPRFITLSAAIILAGTVVTLIVTPSLYLALNARFILYALLSIYFVTSGQLPIKQILCGLLSALLIQCGIAAFQVGFGHSIGLSFLGESLLESGRLGVAKISIGGNTVMRGYGTLPHPNILGGMALSTCILWYILRHNIKSNFLSYIPLVTTIVVLLSLSKSIIAMMIGLHLIYACRHRLHRVNIAHLGIIFISLISTLVLITSLFLWFHLTTFDFISHRVDQYISHIYPLLTNPLGISHIIVPTTDVIAPWDIMPLHNTFLAFWEYFGIISALGLLCFTLMPFMNSQSKYSIYIIPLIPLLLIDHFWFTNPGVFILLVLCFSYHTRLTRTN